MPSHNTESFEMAARNFGNRSFSVPASVGVTCLDAGAREFEKPEDRVIPAAYVFGNVHPMSHSRIGKPFDFERTTWKQQAGQ